MPYYVQTSVELISNGAIGMAIFIIGMLSDDSICASRPTDV